MALLCVIRLSNGKTQSGIKIPEAIASQVRAVDRPKTAAEVKMYGVINVWLQTQYPGTICEAIYEG